MSLDAAPVAQRLVVLQVATTPIPAKTADPRHYIAKLEWFTGPDGFSYWRCPGGDCVGIVDLRSNTQAGAAGGVPQGYAWVTYDYAADICTVGCRYEGLFVAGHATERVGRGVTVSLDIRLGVTLASNTPHEILAELLTKNGDPTGESKWKPLLSDRIYLGGREVWRSPKQWFEGGADSTWQALALEVKREDYRRLRTEDRARGSEHYKRVLDKWSEDFGLPASAFIPVGLPFEGVLPHQTTLTDTFTDTDTTNLGSHTPDTGGSWTVTNGGVSAWQVNSNQLDKLGQNAWARLQVDLSSDDHYCQIDAITNTGDGQPIGCSVRNSTTNHNFYGLRWSGNNTVLANGIGKWVSSSFTSLSTTQPGTFSTGTIKLEVSGTTLTSYFDGGQVSQVTDSSLSGILRTGLYSGGSASVPAIAIDNFEAGDLAGDPEPPAVQRTKSWQATIN